jgi:hypothetical protein
MSGGIEVSAIPITGSGAKAFRALNKNGLHLADFAGLTTDSSFTGFGNGTGYTVSNWISDGVFANLAAVQAVYPICQSGSDYVDWVLLQSAVDFLSYANLGSSNRKNTARTLWIPAGLFKMNRSLQLGYGTSGTPPAGLNGNGYVSPRLIGEGQQYDPSGNGMNGTTLDFSSYTNDVGIAINRGVNVEIRNMTIRGGYTYLRSNSSSILNSAGAWNIANYKDPGLPSANWVGGAAVNIGVAIDPHSGVSSAAAYPARILPAYFGGGTTTASYGGSSDVLLEDVTIVDFVVGYGRPHGDSNGEFLRFNRGNINGCPIGFNLGHSQCRNVSVQDCNFYLFHTAISNKGGTQQNANMHGKYDNIHAAYGYQMLEYDAGYWSGPLTLSNCYMEGVFSIGSYNGPGLNLDTCYFNIWDASGVGLSDKFHLTGTPAFVSMKNCQFITRNGLFLDGRMKVSSENTVVSHFDSSTLTTTDTRNAYAYFGSLFYPGGTHSFESTNIDSGYGGMSTKGSNERNLVDRVHTHAWQEYTTYSTCATDDRSLNDGTLGADALMGGMYRYTVPKIQHRQIFLGTMASRSGQDVVFPRYSFGTLKADIGDVFFIGTSGSEDTICAVVGISGGDMTLRQLNDFYSASTTTDYATSGRTQLTPGSAYHAKYVCTRIRRNLGLVMGSVSAGSAIISSAKNAFGAGNTLTTTFLTMAVGDLFIHQEPDMLNVGGSPVSPLNPITAIDTGAQTITLTNNFESSNANYPVVFYVKVFNA